jgi:PAS domain S-box-containing protein
MSDSMKTHSVKLLVIDDNIEFGIGVKMLLSKDGVEVHTAADGIQGLERVNRLLPDIVLLDVVLPRMDGIEVCKKIRQNPELTGVYIVMLSGLKTQTDQMAEGLEAGADGYIARPIPNRELLARLRAFIRLKRTEKALEKTEKKYQRLFDSMIMAYAHHSIILDENGQGVDFKFLEINPEFEKITGLKRDSLIGKSVLEVFPQTEKKWIDIYARVALTGNEERFINFSGALDKFFEVYAFSPAYGEFSTLFYDVTDREIANEKMTVYNRELEKLNNDKNKFFSIIAHDLKSPFNAIMGFSELLVEQINEKDYDGVQQYASIILQSSQHAIDLLLNLLDWAGAQTGRMDFNPQYFEMANCIEETLDGIEDSAFKKNITIIKKIPENLQVFADKQMLNTVLRNLISNAIKFTAEGGEIIVSAKQTPKDFLVSVKDTGMGIAPERIEKLFRIDANISTPGTNKEKGTGLGLILCKEFIEKHGGKILVESLEGIGSEFKFTLPENSPS